MKIVAVQGAKPRLSTKDPQEEIRKTKEWVERKDPPFPVLVDPTAAYYDAIGFPAGPYPVLVLVDPKGIVVWMGGTGIRREAEVCDGALARLMSGAKKKAAGSDALPR